MRTITIFILLLLTSMLTGCIRAPPAVVTPTPEPVEPVVNESITERPNIILDDNQVNSTEVVMPEQPSVTECLSEEHTATSISSEGSGKSEGYAFNYDGIEYSFSNQGDGILYISLRNNKTKNSIDTISLPTGAYAPKNAVKINDLFAIKFSERTYERIDKIYAKDIIHFRLYNLSSECAYPIFETKPIVTLTCSGSWIGYGDCIGPGYSDYMIQLSAWNEKNYSKFDLSLSIDGGDKLLPFSKDKKIEGNAYMRYDIPFGTFRQGTHILTVELDTDDGILLEENYKMLVLADNKIALKPYQRVSVCYPANTPDFIRYYDTTTDGILIKHNYYPDKLSLASNGCTTSQTGFTICDNGETFSGTFDYKILTLKNAESWCGPQILDLPESCKRTETIEVGDSFEDRYGTAYELVEIYTAPKVVAFKQEKKDWIVYYPYDVGYDYTAPISIQSVNSDSVTILHTDVFCDINN